MTKPTVTTDLTKPLQILTELGIHSVGHNLGVGAVLDVTLPVGGVRKGIEKGGERGERRERRRGRRERSGREKGPVKEVDGDLVGKRVLDDIDQLVDLLLGKLTGTIVFKGKKKDEKR